MDSDSSVRDLGLDQSGAKRAPDYERLQTLIRDDILSGRIAAGSRLKVVDSAKEYGTSTNPARDWPLLAQAVGHADWLENPMFATPEARLANGSVLVHRFDEIFALQPFDHWAKVLHDGDVTFGLVANIYDHLGDQQIEANGLFPEFVDADGLRTLDSPFQIEGETKVAPRMAPGIGEHTRALLAEFGCSPAEIDALAAE